jgi:hypothetical protein
MWNLKAPCTSRNDGHCSAVDHNFLITVAVTEDGNAATTAPSKLVEGHTMIFTGQFTGTTINLDSNNIFQECNYSIYPYCSTGTANWTITSIDINHGYGPGKGYRCGSCCQTWEDDSLKLYR